MNSLTELGPMPVLVERVNAVLADARRRLGVVATFNDAWMVPATHLTDGLGQHLDVVHHCHPGLTQGHDVDLVEISVDGEGMLSAVRHVGLLCEHPMTIGLTRRLSGVTIITGRTLETLLSGGVLLEENAFDSRYFLQSGTHYMPFESWADLRELVPWLLANPEHRQRLARDGQAWVQRHLTGEGFWAGLLDRLYGAAA